MPFVGSIQQYGNVFVGCNLQKEFSSNRAREAKLRGCRRHRRRIGQQDPSMDVRVFVLKGWGVGYRLSPGTFLYVFSVAKMLEYLQIFQKHISKGCV